MGVTAWIYSSSLGNHSSSGISSSVDRVTVVGPGPFEPTEAAPGVMVMPHPTVPRFGCIAVPVDSEGKPRMGGMMGGSFIWTSDSRFPADHPVPLHDRFETR